MGSRNSELFGGKCLEVFGIAPDHADGGGAGDARLPARMRVAI